MVNTVYAIDDFPGDALLWRIEWIGGVGYNTRVPSGPQNSHFLAERPAGQTDERAERPTKQHLPGAASRRPNGSAEREIPVLSNKENGENRRWPATLRLDR